MKKSVQQMVAEFHRATGLPISDKLTELPLSRREMRLGLVTEEVGELVEASAFDQTVNMMQAFARQGDNSGAAASVIRFTSSGLKHIEGRLPNIVRMADGLGDIVYVCYGMALEMGIDLDAVIAEIHRSNMSKLDDDGLPIYREDGKVLKGPNYTPPNIARVLYFQGEQESDEGETRL